MDTATKTETNTEIDTNTIAKVVEYLDIAPRESRSTADIASNTGMTKLDVKAALAALKDVAIVKSSGRGAHLKWWIDLEVASPVALPGHLRPNRETASEATPGDDATAAAATDRTPPATRKTTSPQRKRIAPSPNRSTTRRIGTSPKP